MATLFDDLIPAETGTPPTATGLFDDLVPEPAPQAPEVSEAGRWKRQPETLKEWIQMTVGGALHPIRQTETAIESVASAIVGQPLRLVVRPSEVMETPGFGKFGRFKQAETKPGQVAAGVANAAIGFAEFMTTPEGLLTLGLGKIRKEVAQAVMGDYAADMVIHAPQQLQQSILLAREGRIQEAAEAATSGIGGTLLSATIIKHGAARPTIRDTSGEVRADAADQIQKVQMDQAITTTEQTAPVTAEVLKDVVAEPKPKEQDAIQERKTEEILQDVRTQSVEGAQQVPPEEGAGGIRGGEPAQGVAPGPQGPPRDQVEPGKEPTPTTPAPEPVAVPPETVSGEIKPTVAEPPAADPSAKPEPTPPEPVTPIPPEAAGQGRSVTALKNAMVERDRAKMGLPAFEPVARQSYGEAWDAAMAQMDRDPMAQDKLIADLRTKPRAVKNAQEGALLHHALVTLKNNFNRTTAELTQAHTEGRMEDAASIQATVDMLSDQVLELTDITKAAGTEAGRAFAARQQLIADDFSRVGLEVQKRAAVGGRKLTQNEKSDLAKLAAEYEAKMQELRRKVLESSAGKAAAEKKYSPRILEALERFAKTMDEKAAAASQRLKEKFSRTSAGVDPTILSDLAIIGAAKITRGITDFAAWSDAMIKELGDRVKPELKAAWDASNKLLDDELKGMPAVARTAKAAGKDKAKTINRVRGELNKLEADFKEGLAQDRVARGGVGARAWQQTKKGLSTFRTLKSIWDLSATLFQGGFYVAGHPIRAAGALKAELQAFASEKKAGEIDAEIHNRPNALSGLYRRAKLYLAPLHDVLKGREEEFLPVPEWVNKIPGVRASNRAFVTFLNKLRADAFDAMVASKRQGGREITQAELEAIANYINVATGRGKFVGAFEKASEAMATVFWSPRLTVSRFQLALGQPLWKARGVRGMLTSEYVRSLAGLSAIYTLGQLAGAETENDPASSDFGKMKFGKTRVDPLAGLSQAIVFSRRMTSGEYKKLNGEILDLANPKFGQPDYGDVLKNFLRTKLAPVPATIWNLKQGKDVTGAPVTWEDIPKELLVPLSVGDVVDIAKEHDVPEAVILSLLSTLGMRVSVYQDRKK